MKEAPPACSANYAPLTHRGFLERAATLLADKLYTVYGDGRFSRKEEPHRRYVLLASALLDLSMSRRDIQLLDLDAGDTDNVVKNEVDQAPVTSANPNTYPYNCSLKDQISLIYASLQAEMKSLKVEMKREFDNYARKLRDVHGDGSVNVSETKVRQASIPFANPNYNFCPEKECDAYLRDLDKLSQPINHDNMPREALDQNQINHSTTQSHTSPSNPSNVAVNQQSQGMTMARTPIAVAANDAMPLRSSPHAPLMHQVEEPQSVSNVPIHQPQPIMRQFNSQLYNHSPNPTVQLSPQVPSSVPVVHMPLPVNHFNHQHNVTPPVIPITSMSMTSHLPQPDHMSSAMTGLPQIPSSSPFHLVPHYSTPQNHVGHPVPPITHQYNPQNMSNVLQYNPHHELLPQMISPEFSSDFWLFPNGQHSVNHQPYSDLEAPNDGQTIINKGKPWSDDEHNLFLKGVDKHGKGNWKEISKTFVKTRTPAQIASHAQKYFDRLENNEENNNDNNDRASKKKKKKHP